MKRVRDEMIALGPKTLVIFSVIKKAASSGKPAPTAPTLGAAINATVGAVPYHLTRLKAVGKIEADHNMAGTSVRYYVPEIKKWTGWTQRVMTKRSKYW